MTRLLILLCYCLLAACAVYDSRRGVEVSWQPEVVETFEVGETTRREILKVLGPPSQVVSLQDETVLYYLFEKTRGKGMILIVYNRMEIHTAYDRAIFFFDGNDRLTEYSVEIRPEDE